MSAPTGATRPSERSATRHVERRASSRPLGLEEIVALIGHELRTPLTTVGAAVELLTEADPADVRALTGSVQRQVGRLLMLFEAALRVAEIVGGAEVDPDARVHPGVAIASLSEALSERCDRPIAFNVDEGLPDVAIEAGALVIVLSNLVTNALRHAAGAPLCVSARRSGNRVWVSVADGGAGVPNHLRERLFTRGACTHSGGAGHGLGLFVARSLVRAFGGDVSLDERADGTCFVIDLPVAHGAR